MKEKITIAILLCAIAFLFVAGCKGNGEYYMSSSEVDAIINGISSRRPSGSNAVVSDDTNSDGEDEIETSSEASSKKPSITVSTSSEKPSSTTPSSSKKPESSSTPASSSETATSSEAVVPPTEGDDGEDEISGNEVHIGAPPGVMPPV